MDPRMNPDLIEDALAAQPLAPMPRSITAEVMLRIQTDVRPQWVTWNDLILGSVVMMCLAALWFTYLNLPPIVLAKLRIQGLILYYDFLVNARWLVPTLFFGLAALLAIFTIPALIKMTTDRHSQT